MAEPKVITAAIALIKVESIGGELKTIGRMRNLRITENIRRGRVVGLGEVKPSELPVLEWSGTVNVGQYAFKTDTSVINALSRKFSSTTAFIQSLLFDEGINIQLQKKLKKEDGTYAYETFATVNKAHLTSEGLDISEGQIGGRDGTFEFTEPLTYA